jgi:hypothetical protein
LRLVVLRYTLGMSDYERERGAPPPGADVGDDGDTPSDPLTSRPSAFEPGASDVGAAGVSSDEVGEADEAGADETG